MSLSAEPSGTPPLGVLAGQGDLPLEVARALRRGGRRVLAVGLRGLTEPELATCVDQLEWLYPGEFEALLGVLRGAGVRDLVFAGGVPKVELLVRSAELRLDARARRLLREIRAWGDDALLRLLADEIEAEGIRIRGQDGVAPELLAPPGALGSIAPTVEQGLEIASAWPIAQALGDLDIGQTIVVRGGIVLAVEAIEGTDAAIRRGAALAPGGGVSVIKILKPSQDRRFDLPTIGPQTALVLRECGAVLLAVQAGHTLVLKREELVRIADEAGICVCGVDPATLPPAQGDRAGAGAASAAG